LGVTTVDDEWGSWGGHDGEEEANHVNRVKAVWKIDAVEILERGPERASLWVRWKQGSSWLELTFQLNRDDPAVIVRARVFWAEKAARLKLNFSRGGEAEFEVPGGQIRRSPSGDVPGGRWVRVGEGAGAFVFASDALYNFDLTEDSFGATVVRSCRYATTNRSTPKEQPWRPYMDLGELTFNFAIGGAEADGAALAQRLESPPVAMIATSHVGNLARSGSLLQLRKGLRLLAFLPAEAKGGWVLRVQNTTPRPVIGSASFLGAELALGQIAAGRIQSSLLEPIDAGWRITAVSGVEEPVEAQAAL
jgi:alpha-mannosidase